MNIKEIRNPWRDRWRDAYFRTARFFVESDARSGGRRIAMHEYPKRNVPYAEDMGRKATRIMVQGYLIGPNYLDDKNTLIAALERDGPGLLRLPLPYLMADVRVMCTSYSVTESRERGGFCTIEMEFQEYGDPENRGAPSTAGQIESSALSLEDNEIGNPDPLMAGPYAQVHNSANAGLPSGFKPGYAPMSAAYKKRLAEFRQNNR